MPSRCEKSHRDAIIWRGLSSLRGTSILNPGIVTTLCVRIIIFAFLLNVIGLILKVSQLFGNVMFSLIEAYHFTFDGIDNIHSWVIVHMVKVQFLLAIRPCISDVYRQAEPPQSLPSDVLHYSLTLLEDGGHDL